MQGQTENGVQATEDVTTAVSSTTSSWTHDDLIDLIRAVKFANKDATIRAVHKEITTVMSQNPSFEFLSNVPLDDVKKVWKKALSKSSCAGTDGVPPPLGVGDSSTQQPISNENLIAQQHGILKFYTVGNPTVQSLAERYTLQAASKVAQDAAVLEQQRQEELEKYVHCFLNVPADQSGTKPYQALINFNQNPSGSSKSSTGGTGNSLRSAGKKKKGKVKQSNVGNNQASNACDAVGDGRDIVKIQVAASLPGMEDLKMPMLLYNADRSAKTFIHPDDDDHGDVEGGYDKIRKIILEQGQKGILSGGGTKAYFYSRISRRPGGEDIVSIDVTSGLAPMQNW